MDSIKQFLEKDTPEVYRLYDRILEGTGDLNDLIKDVRDRLLQLGLHMIEELLEQTDRELRDLPGRSTRYHVERKNQQKELLCSMGVLHFRRTGYKDLETGKYVCLLDRLLGIGRHDRVTTECIARILEEALESSYAKGGRAASPKDKITKQAVKEWVHGLDFSEPVKEQKEKKKLRYLHIVADEDHVAAQFHQRKGDLEKDENGNKNNTILSKLIVLYEDIYDEASEKQQAKGKHRYRLIGKHVFSGTHKGSLENEYFWQEVADYIEKTYDTDELERIYIAGDGAQWIKAGTQILIKSRFVLDRFHMMKYVNESVAHLEDSADDAKSEIWEALNAGNRKELGNIYGRILAATESESKAEAVKKAYRYFINQWDGIMTRVEERGGCWKCCAEGQVSHILSARMSSRPMGWSEKGCDQMSHLRAYRENDGKVMDLLRYKEKQEKEKRGREEQEEKDRMIREYRRNRSGAYEDVKELQIPGISLKNMKWMRDFLENAI